MISIEGKYSFETLAAFISNPSNPTDVANNLRLECLDRGSGNVIQLIPLNSHHSKTAYDSQILPAITFALQDLDFMILAHYVLVMDKDSRYFLFLSESNSSVSEELHKSVAQTVLEFLNIEFGVERFQLFDGLPDFLSPKLNLVSMRASSIDIPCNSKSEEVSIAEKPALENILTAGPSISILEHAYVSDAIKNGWNSQHSEYLDRFEKEFAEYVGVKHAIATSSCTGALHLSLLALGIGSGDEVLVPDITWVATASAIRYVGAKPIFVDVDKLTWTIDVDLLEQQITPRTKAIMPVHLYGYGALMPEIMMIAKKHDLYVVEDAAPAIGTRIETKMAGSFGNFGCFSFQGAKLLVTGEGGMLVTDDTELFAKAKKIQDHGRKPGTFWIEEIGHKYKMNNITAALGLGQIQRSENQILRKRKINSWYRDALADVPGIFFQEEASGTDSICWMTSFTIDPKHSVSRDRLIQELKLRGIDSRPVFPSISQYPIWGYEAMVPTNSKFVGDHGINLPSGVLLSENSVQKVVSTIKQILK